MNSTRLVPCIDIPAEWKHAAISEQQAASSRYRIVHKYTIPHSNTIFSAYRIGATSTTSLLGTQLRPSLSIPSSTPPIIIPESLLPPAPPSFSYFIPHKSYSYSAITSFHRTSPPPSTRRSVSRITHWSTVAGRVFLCPFQANLT
jgi:hypothetical protein